MTSLPNIEKSGFRSGEYVGYANGVWRIVRTGRAGWAATSPTGSVRRCERTLSALSQWLAAQSAPSAE